MGNWQKVWQLTAVPSQGKLFTSSFTACRRNFLHTISENADVVLPTGTHPSVMLSIIANSFILQPTIYMKRIVVVLIVFLALTATETQAQQQDWAVGLRLGDPVGVNVRKYFGSGNALDMNIGSSGYWYGGRGRDYRDGYRQSGLAVLVNYVWQKDFPNADGLQWYYGLGGQFTTGRYSRYYNDGTPGRPFREEYRISAALGATGVIGLEYFISDTPISVFAEAGLYLEIVPAPFWLSVPAAIGGRYNF